MKINVLSLLIKGKIEVQIGGKPLAWQHSSMYTKGVELHEERPVEHMVWKKAAIWVGEEELSNSLGPYSPQFLPQITHLMIVGTDE